MTRLEQLIASRDRAEAKAREACAKSSRARRAINDWGKAQIERALAKKGITPGKSIVRMQVRRTKQGQIRLDREDCLLEKVFSVSPPTMERGALGPNACSSDMWWVAQFNWRSVRKDGQLGTWYDCNMLHGDTVADVVGQIEHVRDLEEVK